MWFFIWTIHYDMMPVIILVLSVVHRFHRKALSCRPSLKYIYTCYTLTSYPSNIFSSSGKPLQVHTASYILDIKTGFIFLPTYF